ncbi:MAG: tRNA-dihydrouridine(20/20a) synthase [Lysobacteraceae bacterium]|nr:MAG: tRNA-dihydrouridine(20/20a) synthase [Xanthomonadaceae bacterium]
MVDRALDPKGKILAVAPMMDWTDRHCRMFHRQLSPRAWLYTEMVHADAVRLGDRERLLGFSPEEHPVALQLGGSDPRTLAEAARIVEDMGYDAVNLNVGCPSSRVQAGRFGACLMREPALVADCVAAMRAAVSIEVTVKCRLGVDEQDPRQALFGLVEACVHAGCRHFVVHARKAWLQGLSPKENRDIPPLDYAQVRRLKRERPGLTVVLNGGLTTTAAVAAELPHVDGVMLGRAAYHTPYLLHELDAMLSGRELEPRSVLLRRYRPYFEDRVARGDPPATLLRPILGLFHGQPGGRAFRRLLSTEAHRPGVGWELVERALTFVERGSLAA